MINKTNIVEDYLKDNINKNLSIKTIKRNLHIKRRHILYLIHKSDNVVNVDPLHVGSSKKKNQCLYL